MGFNTSLQQKRFFGDSVNVIIPSVFILVGLLAAFNHSLWRDEMQGWLVAWNSDSFVSLWRNNAPSGHPVLWSALIYMTKGLTGTPLSMQLLHWFLGSCAVLCFWRWCPLVTWQKAMFTFGYYPFWEYFFVCRHYVLAELLVFIFCSSFSIRRKTYIPAALCIGLLANTHALAWSLSFACGCTLLIEWFTSPFQRKSYISNRFHFWDFILSLFILSSLVAFGAYSLLQVRDVVNVYPSFFDVRQLFKILGQVFGGYLLVIPNSRKWLDLSICAIVAIVLILSTLNFLKRSKPAIVFFVSGTSFLFLFNYFLFLGDGSRHYGYYFLILISSVWIAIDTFDIRGPNVSSSPIFKSYLKGFNFYPNVLTFCLAIHLAAGLHMSISDFIVPYSAGKETASYIRKQGWQDLPIFGTRDVEVATVSGYLDRQFYLPELKGWGSYAKWSERKGIDRKDTLKEVATFFLENPQSKRILLLLSNRSNIEGFNSGSQIISDQLKITKIKSFENSFHDSERFYLYWAEQISL